MGPSNDRDDVILNNYDDRPSIVNNAAVRAKVEYVAEVKFDRNELKKVSEKRDVYLYPGGDLDLNKHEYNIQKTSNTKKKSKEKDIFAYP